MVSELNLAESRTAEFKLEVDRLAEQCRTFKKKYFDLKKTHETLLKKVKAPMKDKTCQSCGDCPKNNGGLSKNGIITRTEVLFDPPK